MKNLKKIMGFLLFPILLLALSVSSFALSVDVRIEGISETFYNGTVEVEEGTTLAQILTKLDAENEDLTIVGIENSYVTDVNGDVAASFGGWDGWLFLLNGVDPVASISDVTVSDGDDVVFYFGDPFGMGMQFPYVAESPEKGVYSFLSNDTSYDENWNPVVVANPVAGATLTVNGKTFITDENGEADLSSALLPGVNSVFVERYMEINGGYLPTVLRGFVEVQGPESNPSTSDLDLSFLLLLFSAAALFVFMRKCKRV